MSNNRCPVCHRLWKIRDNRYWCDCGGSYSTKYFKDGIAFCSNPYFVWAIESTYGTVPSSSPTYSMAGMLVTIQDTKIYL